MTDYALTVSQGQDSGTISIRMNALDGGVSPPIEKIVGPIEASRIMAELSRELCRMYQLVRTYPVKR